MVVITGFFFVGSPKDERMRRFDSERVAHLQQLQWNIIDYWQSKGKLPAQLADLNDPTRGVIVPVDPETGVAYDYEIKGVQKFALCATFSLPSGGAVAPSEVRPKVPAPVGGVVGADIWTHEAGRACFDRTIDKDFFIPKKTPVG